mgnify:FL=1
MHTSFVFVLRRTLFVCFLLLVCKFSLHGLTAFASDASTKTFPPHLYTTLSNNRLTVEYRLTALLKSAGSDRERAWLIYRWVTHHFKHDSRIAALIGDPHKHSLDHLFQSAGGSCAIFANVMHRLLDKAGLEVKTVYGMVKGAGASQFINGMPVNHVWNTVKIDGTWHLLDATWGAGYVGRDGFHREQSDLFFMVPPQRAVLSHYDPADQLGYQAKLGVDQAVFKRFADDATYLAAVGFDAKSILKRYAGEHRGELVAIFNPLSASFKVIEAPLAARLQKRPIKFRIDSSAYDELMVLQGKTWSPMRKSGNVHSIELRPVDGELLVMARRAKEHEYEALLAYSVK